MREVPARKDDGAAVGGAAGDGAVDGAAALKSRGGAGRVWRALLYSRDGFFAALRHEHAFRQELVFVTLAAGIAVSLHFFGPELPWSRVALLLAALVPVLVVELLNSAVETCVDYISTARHPLAKRAKDLGSAAVAGAFVFAGLLWLAVLL